MKKGVLRAWLLSSLCIVLSCLFAFSASADEKKDWPEIGYAQVTANTALRTKKNTKTLSSIVKVVKKGQIVKVIKDAGSGWYKVSIGSKTGYLHGDFFTDEDDEDLSDNVVTRVMAIDLTLRSTPKVTSENSIGVIGAGSKVTILGERSDNWVHISYSSSGDEEDDAYIKNGFFLSDPKTGKGYSWRVAAQDLFIRSSTTPSSTNVVGTLKKGKKVKVIGVSGNWYKVRYKSSVRYVKEGYFTNEATTDYVSETIASRINFRTSPKIAQDNILKVLSPGTTVRVYKSVAKNWYHVKTGTATGYLLAGYFVSDIDEDDPDPSPGVLRTTTAALRMRTGRGTSYSVITVIPKGAIVTLSIKYGDWYKVKYTASDGTLYTGWVDGQYLSET